MEWERVVGEDLGFWAVGRDARVGRRRERVRAARREADIFSGSVADLECDDRVDP